MEAEAPSAPNGLSLVTPTRRTAGSRPSDPESPGPLTTATASVRTAEALIGYKGSDNRRKERCCGASRRQRRLAPRWISWKEPPAGAGDTGSILVQEDRTGMGTLSPCATTPEPALWSPERSPQIHVPQLRSPALPSACSRTEATAGRTPLYSSGGPLLAAALEKSEQQQDPTPQKINK